MEWVSKTGHEKMRESGGKTRKERTEADAELERKRMTIILRQGKCPVRDDV